jgi:molybdate transport system ATP-binding protein
MSRDQHDDAPALFVRALVRGPAGAPPRLDVELSLTPGIAAVMGPSGAGKSTLLAAIAGLARPDEGRIELGGRPLFDSARGLFVPTHRRRVALVLQSLALFPHLTAWQNVAYALPRREGVTGAVEALLERGERRVRAMRWLARARVEHVAERAPASLSGGEAQRVALARALASEPSALLLDEPFSALDAGLRRALGEELVALVRELCVPALLVTHHADDAARLGSRTVLLEGGRVRHDGSPPLA